SEHEKLQCPQPAKAYNKNAFCTDVQKALICIILVRQLFLSDVLVRLFHALDPLRTTPYIRL
ncbi:MAG: hypothetical protein ACLUV8_06305, partial [Clostridium sp.]